MGDEDAACFMPDYPQSRRRGGRTCMLGSHDAATALRRAGWDVDVCETVGAGSGTGLARDAVISGCTAVIVAGGDGTINEVIQELANTPVALGIVPLGTVNVWALELGISATAVGAAAALVSGQIRTIDLGRANDRYFLLMGSAGFDAHVTRNVSTRLKRWWGPAAYIVTAGRSVWRYTGTRARVVLDGDEVECSLLMLVAGNTRLYGGRMVEITPLALVDDGLLDVCIFTGRGARDLVHYTWAVLRHRHTKNMRGVLCRRVRRVEVYAERPLPVQVDGDYAGTMQDIILSVAPAALRVIMPPGTRNRLFGEVVSSGGDEKGDSTAGYSTVIRA